MLERLRRLWKLSEYDVLMPEDSVHGALPKGSQVTMIVKKPQQLAKIINMQEDTEDFPDENVKV